tara:strand:+ start:209 stop:409 length:201 start_codon:yes stop_codon:yes gene_type:complete
MKEYALVTGVMFRLYMGQKFDYNETFDPNFMQDIQMIWKNFKQKRVEKKAKIVRLNVIEGGKLDGK